MGLHDLGHGQVLAGQAGRLEGLDVELVLEVLEGERVVEDLHVVLLGRLLAQRDAGEAAQEHAAAQGGCATECGLAEEVGAAVTGDGLFGLADGAVLVYELQLHQIGHMRCIAPFGIGGLLAVLQSWRRPGGFGSPPEPVGARPLVASRLPAIYGPAMAATGAEPQPAQLPLPGGTKGATVRLHPLICARMQCAPAFLDRPDGRLGSLKALVSRTPEDELVEIPVVAFLVRHPSAGDVLVDTGLHPSVAVEPKGALGRWGGLLFRDIRMATEDSVPAQLRALDIDPRPGAHRGDDPPARRPRRRHQRVPRGHVRGGRARVGGGGRRLRARRLRPAPVRPRLRLAAGGLRRPHRRLVRHASAARSTCSATAASGWSRPRATAPATCRWCCAYRTARRCCAATPRTRSTRSRTTPCPTSWRTSTATCARCARSSSTWSRRPARSWCPATRCAVYCGAWTALY